MIVLNGNKAVGRQRFDFLNKTIEYLQPAIPVLRFARRTAPENLYIGFFDCRVGERLQGENLRKRFAGTEPKFQRGTVLGGKIFQIEKLNRVNRTKRELNGIALLVCLSIGGFPLSLKPIADIQPAGTARTRRLISWDTPFRPLRLPILEGKRFNWRNGTGGIERYVQSYDIARVFPQNDDFLSIGIGWLNLAKRNDIEILSPVHRQAKQRKD